MINGANSEGDRVAIEIPPRPLPFGRNPYIQPRPVHCEPQSCEAICRVRTAHQPFRRTRAIEFLPAFLCTRRSDLQVAIPLTGGDQANE